VTADIRILGRDELLLLESVAPDVFDDPIDLPATRAFLADPRHHLAVVIDDSVVVGFASAVHYVHPDKARPELWINEVGVAPAHQGCGNGKALLRALFALGRELGCSEAWVLTERTNGPAMRLYALIGGEEDPDDTVMFSFSLDGAERSKTGG